MRAELAAIAAKLTERGTRLRPPADEQILAQLEDTLEGRLSEPARTLFATFDGFADEMADQKTMVCLWSADAVRERVRQSESIGTKPAIGDHFLGADLLCCDLRSDASKVWWNDRGTIAAESLLEFLWEVGEGTFEL